MRYFLVALLIPNSVWTRINERVKATEGRATEAETSNKILAFTNTNLTEEVADLKSRLAKALTVDHPNAKK